MLTAQETNEVLERQLGRLERMSEKAEYAKALSGLTESMLDVMTELRECARQADPGAVSQPLGESGIELRGRMDRAYSIAQRLKQRFERDFGSNSKKKLDVIAQLDKVMDLLKWEPDEEVDEHE